jgi:hypothetical protein
MCSASEFFAYKGLESRPHLLGVPVADNRDEVVVYEVDQSEVLDGLVLASGVDGVRAEDRW